MLVPRPRCSTEVRSTLLLLATAFLSRVKAFGEAPKYLIVSTPASNKVMYMSLPARGAPAIGDARGLKPLIQTNLTYPQGIAVDEYRKMLYVADPKLHKVVRYPLQHVGDQLAVGPKEDVAVGVETRAIAVDGLGNVWFTDEPTHRILRVTAAKIEAKNTTAEEMFVGSPHINAPGGIAVDNFFVYWLNKREGTSVGSLIRGLQQDEGNASVTSLASNADKCYGVCLALGNIFYTDESNHVYGINRASTAAHNPVAVTSDLGQPRGCSFDGDNTVYVADRAGNAVYQFASNMNTLMANRQMTKVIDLPGAFGVAVYVEVMS